MATSSTAETMQFLKPAQKRVEAALALQKELLEAYDQASRDWLARVQSELALWSDLGKKLVSTRSVPEAQVIGQRQRMGRSRKSCVSKGPGQGPARALAGSATAPAGHRQAGTRLAGAFGREVMASTRSAAPRAAGLRQPDGEPSPPQASKRTTTATTAAPKIEPAGSERPGTGAPRERRSLPWTRLLSPRARPIRCE
jgi:hypothetical protein